MINSRFPMQPVGDLVRRADSQGRGQELRRASGVGAGIADPNELDHELAASCTGYTGGDSVLGTDGEWAGCD